MDYFDGTGTYSKSKVINGIIEVEEKVQDEVNKDNPNNETLTRLRYEQMLRGLYLWSSPYEI